jgi:hypothetical protein
VALIYVVRAIALAYPNEAGKLDTDDTWQRSRLPEAFADFVCPN